MAYVKDDFMMKSIPHAADDDVILIQSDDDTESDDVVLVSDSDSNDCPRLPSNCKKPHKNGSRRRKKKLHPLCDMSECADFHDHSNVSNRLDFSSEVNFYAQSSSMKETTTKAFNHSLFLTDKRHSHRGKSLDVVFRNNDYASLENEFYYSASTDTSISCQGSAPLLPNGESASVFGQNSHLAEKVPSDLPTIAEFDFPDKADVAESAGDVVAQDESISRDEMALLADVDVSLLSNISFCSDLSNDLPSDLPSSLSIDLVHDFNSLESGLEMEKSAGSLECSLTLGPLGDCLEIASYSKHAFNMCSEGNPASVTYHCDADNARISDDQSEAENICNFANVGGNSCSVEARPCTAPGLCDMEDAIPVMNGNFLSRANICDLENVARNPYEIGISHSTGNLLEMGIFPELGNSLEIESLSAMDDLQEFQNLPEMETDEIYLEDKDLEVDLSSTFIKDVLNLNVGEAISDSLADPLNFSSIASAFDSLISTAPHLVLSSALPVTIAQHPLMSSSSSLVHSAPLTLESSLSFESQHYVLSSDANSLLTCASSASATHLISSSASFAQHFDGSAVSLPPSSVSSSISYAQHFDGTAVPLPPSPVSSSASYAQHFDGTAVPLPPSPVSSSASYAQHFDGTAVPLPPSPLSTDASVSFTVQPQLSSTVYVEQHLVPSVFAPSLENEEDARKMSVAQETADEVQLQPISCEQMEDLLTTSDAVGLDEEVSSVDDKNNADSDDLTVDLFVDETSRGSQCSSVASPQTDSVVSEGQMATDGDAASVLHKSPVVSDDSLPSVANLPLVMDSVSVQSVSSVVTKAFDDKSGNDEDHKMVVNDTSFSSNAHSDTDFFKTYQHSPAKESFLSNDNGKMSPNLKNGLSSVSLSSGCQKVDELTFSTLNNLNDSLSGSCCPLLTDNEITAKEGSYLPDSLMTSMSNVEDSIKSVGMLDLKVKEGNSGQCFLNQFRLGKRPRNESTGTVDEPVIDVAWKKVRLDEQTGPNDQLLEDEANEKREGLDESCDIDADDIDTHDRPENLNEESDEYEEDNHDLNAGFQDVSNDSQDIGETTLCLSEGVHHLTEKEEDLLEENLDYNEELEETNLVLNEGLHEAEDLDEAVLVDDEDMTQDKGDIELEGTLLDVDEGPHHLSTEGISQVENLDVDKEIEDPSREIEGLNRDDLDMNEASQNISNDNCSLKSRNGQLLSRDVHGYEHLNKSLELNMKSRIVDKENMVIRSQNKSDLDCNYNRLNGRCHRPKAASPPVALGCESHNDCSAVEVVIDSVDVSKAKCFNCLMAIAKSVLAYCTAGHGCCSGCLNGQVKAFLATSSKSPFSCQFQGCNSFYLISQLRSSLPKMVVDILEAKLEREYSDSTAQLLKKVNGIHEMNIDTDDEEQDDKEPVYHPGTSLPSEICAPKDTFELPLRWGERNKNEYQLIDITANSDEFAEVSELFHRTMFKSRATILRLQRLQNPVLWEFYTVKKKQKEMEGVDKRSFERLLFHGIRREFVDTICLNNFDWRTCGVSHGIMYGQGTYFARDASYAHRYTDRNPNVTSKSCSSHLNVTMTSDDMTPVSQVDDVSQILPSDAPSSDPEAQVVSQSLSELPARTSVAPDDWERHAHLMFLARVIVGRYTRGKRIYRKPPAIDLFVPYGKCYDSCVNYVDDPTLFVIFDSSQYYPEYLIHYSNRPKLTSP